MNEPNERTKPRQPIRQEQGHTDHATDRIQTGGVSNCVTTVAKDCLVALPYILTPKRTEFGKRVRKEYEAKLANYKRSDMTELTPREDGKSNTITTVQKDNLLAEQELLGYTRDNQGKVTDRHPVDLANTIHGSTGHGGNTDQFVKKNLKLREYEQIDEANTFEVLSILRQENGTQKILEEIRRLRMLYEEKILQQGMHEKSICDKMYEQSGEGACSPLGEKDSIPNREKTEGVRDMRFNEDNRCASQEWELAQQFIGEFDGCLQKLSHETPSSIAQGCLSYLRRYCRMQGSVQQTLHKMEEIWKSVDVLPQRKTRLRIRKLSEREVFRLMDVDEKFIDKMMASGVSRSRLYFAAGNSIVVACMEHIFENLFFPTLEHSVDENGQLSLF